MDTSRRAFFKKGLGVVATVSVAQLIADRVAYALDLPHLDEASGLATGLGYKSDATKVDKAKFPRYQAGMSCSGCARYQGTPDAQWGGCGIFVGQAVNAKGWCTAFVPKT